MADVIVGEVSFVGPFPGRWEVLVGGYRVPRVTAFVAEDGTVHVTLDERYGVSGTAEECAKWLWIVANAMAIGAGYSCHGENSTEANPYKVKAMCLGGSAPVLTLVPPTEPAP